MKLEKLIELKAAALAAGGPDGRHADGGVGKSLPNKIHFKLQESDPRHPMNSDPSGWAKHQAAGHTYNATHENPNTGELAHSYTGKNSGSFMSKFKKPVNSDD